MLMMWIQYINTEQFTEDKNIVDIQYNLELDCIVTQNGYRPLCRSLYYKI